MNNSDCSDDDDGDISYNGYDDESDVEEKTKIHTECKILEEHLLRQHGKEKIQLLFLHQVIVHNYCLRNV